MLISSRDKIKAHASVGRGRGGRPLCEPGFELLLGREPESRARRLNGTEKKNIMYTKCIDVSDTYFVIYSGSFGEDRDTSYEIPIS